jgi:hypothetical protein
MRFPVKQMWTDWSCGSDGVDKECIQNIGGKSLMIEKKREEYYIRIYKVFILELAMKAERESRGIALLFL